VTRKASRTFFGHSATMVALMASPPLERGRQPCDCRCSFLGLTPPPRPMPVGPAAFISGPARASSTINQRSTQYRRGSRYGLTGGRPFSNFGPFCRVFERADFGKAVDLPTLGQGLSRRRSRVRAPSLAPSYHSSQPFNSGLSRVFCDHYITNLRRLRCSIRCATTGLTASVPRCG
jgi:hypothetical protein